MLSQDEPPKPKSKLWILYSFLAMCTFLLENFTVGQISKDTGPYIGLYFAAGQILTGIVFNFYEMCHTGNKW